MRRAAVCLLLACGAAACLTPTPAPPTGYEELFLELQATARLWDEALSAGDVEHLQQSEIQMRNLANRHIDVLMRELELGGEPDRKRVAAFALGFCDTKRETLIPVLLASMDDGSPAVRKNAAYALGRLQPDPVPVEAYRRLLSDAHGAARVGALAGLEWLLPRGDDRTLLPDIHAQLTHREPEVRAEAAALLAHLAIPTSVDPLIAAIRVRDQPPPVLINAAEALKEIGDERATEALIDLLRSPYTEVVSAAWYALRRITGQDLDRRWHSWQMWWEERQRQGQGATQP